MKSKFRTESGQILVILSLGVVMLLGATALAVDAGMFYTDRRYDQNTADNAALAGALAAAEHFNENQVNKDDFSCSDPDVLDAITVAGQAVSEKAAEFGAPVYFNIDDYNNNDQGIYVGCSDTTEEDGKSLLISVKLSSETKTSFIQFVYKGNLRNRVEAITRVEPGINNPPGPVADGLGLVGLSKVCINNNNKSTVGFSGQVDVSILTGGIHSNSCMYKNAMGTGFVLAGNGSTYYSDFTGDENHFWELDEEGNIVKAAPEQLTTYVEVSIDPPICGEEKTFKKKDTTISPGTYTSIIQPNGDLTFEPGLYCLESGAKFSGNNAISVSGDDKEGITIYLLGGDFDVSGNIAMDLRAAHQDGLLSIANGAIPGLLLYSDADNDAIVSMLGNSDSVLRGTVYVPNGLLEFGGASYVSNWGAQMLGERVWVHAGTLILDYDDDDLYWDEGEVSQPLLDVYQ